ncbi:hypothetical protein [Halobaculum marinum]|uniref:Uncharacterized protein n=1 Tax=Halobaculum marinum TaxID=3031996 RepID=A0ABD5WXP7_9EURY|nr:hypothetical protein [Halobaculum sp. DT55]
MTGRAVAFWSAVTLPFASLVVLFGGAVTRVDFLVLLVLVSANVVALYFGRSYALERVENNAYTDGGDDDTGGDAEVAPEESRIER